MKPEYWSASWNYHRVAVVDIDKLMYKVHGDLTVQNIGGYWPGMETLYSLPAPQCILIYKRLIP